ncbi:MAG: hypothetical protein LBO04_03445 [Spirochaetaceae bacterium]|jgi:hypothetical protein|nr:hypothetical protein [Spirochaetaceae bacterium]
MKAEAVFPFILFLLCGAARTGFLSAQSVPDGPYQTPPVLYVGDRGSLVYPLDIFTKLPEVELVFPDGLPVTDEVVIHKVDLDRRDRRVIIEFQAFRTGLVELPPIPLSGEVWLRGLQVNIASILDSEKGAMTLSPGAGLLSAPGTFWIITAFSMLSVIVLAVFLLLWLKGGALFAGISGAIRTRLLLHRVNARLRSLEKRLELGQITEKDALSVLSSELRAFLSRLWKRPCYAVSAGEFLYFELPEPLSAGGKTDAGYGEAGTVRLLSALSAFFSRCDALRFASGLVTRETARTVCDEAKALVTGAELAKSKPAGNGQWAKSPV